MKKLVIFYKSQCLDILIDDEDARGVFALNWKVKKGKNGYYITSRTIINGKTTNIMLHRFIMGVTSPTVIVDHINHDTLDNRRVNLRCTTSLSNARNQKRQKNNTSGYKGVVERGVRFGAHIQVNGRQIWLGMHDTAEDAARAYDDKARELGDDFSLNFPMKGEYGCE